MKICEEIQQKKDIYYRHIFFGIIYKMVDIRNTEFANRIINRIKDDTYPYVLINSYGQIWSSRSLFGRHEEKVFELCDF